MGKNRSPVLIVCAALTAGVIVLALPAVGPAAGQEVPDPKCLLGQCSPPPAQPPPTQPPATEPAPTVPAPAAPAPTPTQGESKPPPAPAKTDDPQSPGATQAPPGPTSAAPGAPPGAPAASPPPAPAPPGPAAPGLQVPVYPRTASRTTARLIEILQPAIDQGAIKPQDLRLFFAPFPIVGLAYFSDDWGFLRTTPTPHLHKGTDIFADRGTPVVAYGPGTVKGVGDQAVGGLSVWVHYDDGKALYYTHLSGFAPGLAVGLRVEMGTELAYVGNTGNASGGAHHVHLEIHPEIRDSAGRVIASGTTTLPNGQGSSNTPPTNPKPYLDEWLDQAEQKAQAFVAGLLQQYAEIPRQAHISRRVNELFSLETAERPGDLLWFSAAQPELGVLGLARQAAGKARLTEAVGSIAQRTAEQNRLAAVRQAVQAPLYNMATFTGVPFFEETGSGGPD